MDKSDESTRTDRGIDHQRRALLLAAGAGALAAALGGRAEAQSMKTLRWGVVGTSIKWSYRAPGDQVMLRVFVGGGHHEELVHTLDDAAMTKTALEELDGILGLRANPTMTKVYRWFKGMPKYTMGHLDRIEVLDRTLAAYPGLHLIGCSYKGIGIGDCIHEAQVAAERILQE